METSVSRHDGLYFTFDDTPDPVQEHTRSFAEGVGLGLFIVLAVLLVPAIIASGIYS